MTLTRDDRAAIADLIALHGHLVDSGQFDRLDELFTVDVVYDLEALGYGRLTGIDAIRDAAVALGDKNPVGHHVTNVLITDANGGDVEVSSKGFGVQADGSVGSVVYEDVVRREPQGWRIASRKVLPRRTPLQR
ncbi:MAG: nuclear transport factor 2 family protein [Acidimicrobiia bacterium]|nr:nuclear transport factor 2 family protein [Acidimicrobiia bacterium]